MREEFDHQNEVEGNITIERIQEIPKRRMAPKAQRVFREDQDQIEEEEEVDIREYKTEPKKQSAEQDSEGQKLLPPSYR